ncbi:MAG: superoxide dismutase [Candidatus Nanoarchaeia archaeon]
MAREARNFDNLLGELVGISDEQLKAHFGLYNGYVKKLNEIEEKLKTQDKSATNYSFGEFSELKRREAVAFNGMFLHELYFENLAKDGGEPSLELKKVIDEAFGSWEAFELDLKSSAASTPGWVVLTKNKTDGKLHTYILYEHHIGLPVHQEIILALDCWEHAFMIDYGTKKSEYLAAFMANVNWSKVNERFNA